MSMIQDMGAGGARWIGDGGRALLINRAVLCSMPFVSHGNTTQVKAPSSEHTETTILGLIACGPWLLVIYFLRSTGGRLPVGAK